MKIGHLRFTLEDLHLPLPGLPVTVARTYDSRDTSPGDFGAGWRLDIQSTKLRLGRPLGTDWTQAATHATFPRSFCPGLDPLRTVTITLPDGRQEVFDLIPTTAEGAHNSQTFGKLPPQCQWLVPVEFATAVYQPRPGTVSTLEALADRDLIVVGGPGDSILLFSLATLDVYAPTRFRLTTLEGLVLELEEARGVEKLTDPNGNTLTFGPDGLRHSAGTRVAFTRDGQGRITRITDPTGHTLQYTYDAEGDLTSVTNPLGETTTYTYSPRVPHHLVQILDATGREVSGFTYDPAGRLTRTCDATAHCTTLVHDLAGRQETVVDATGRRVTSTYDERGNVLAVTNGLGHTTRFAYDAADNLVQVTDANGQITTHTYDARRNRLSTTLPYAPGQDPAEVMTTYTYDARDQLTSVTTPAGAQWHLTYDTAGNLTAITDASGALLLARTYGPHGVVLTERDTFGTTSTTYNDAGQPLTSTDLFGDSTTLVHDARGRLTRMTAGDGVTATFTYDAAGRETVADYGHGITLVHGYGTGPDWSSLEAPTFGHLQRRWTPTGRLGGWALPDGGTVTYLQDGAGRLLEEIDPLGRRTRFTYDAAGQLSSLTDATGATEMRAYDPRGALARQTDALGQTTHYTYTPNGRLATLTDARGSTWRYHYTPTTATLTDPLGRETTTTASPHGLLLTLRHPDGTTQETRSLLPSPLQDAQTYPTS